MKNKFELVKVIWRTFISYVAIKNILMYFCTCIIYNVRDFFVFRSYGLKHVGRHYK